MRRTALVIHTDEMRLRFVCETLVMFRPGFKVSTARDLDAARDWLEIMSPDLVVVEAAIENPAALKAWAAATGLDPDRTIVFGEGVDAVRDIGRATVPDSASLPELLATVHDTVSRADEHGFTLAERENERATQ